MNKCVIGRHFLLLNGLIQKYSEEEFVTALCPQFI